MNYLDGKHYIITLLYKDDYSKYYIISDKNPLQNKEINKYLLKWAEEFFDIEDIANICAEEYGIFFDNIYYKKLVQHYLNNIKINCTLITDTYKNKIDWFNKQNWIKL